MPRYDDDEHTGCTRCERSPPNEEVVECIVCGNECCSQDCADDCRDNHDGYRYIQRIEELVRLSEYWKTCAKSAEKLMKKWEVKLTEMERMVALPARGESEESGKQ